MKLPSSIHSRITLFVMAFSLAALLINTLRNDAWLCERQWQRGLASADAQGALLAGTMQHYLRNKLQRAAELQISYSATADNLQAGVVLNEADMIVFATRLEWVGMKFSESPLAAKFDHCDRVRAQMNGEVHRNAGEQSIQVIYPFFTRFDPANRGVVLLSYDMGIPLEQARREALHESLSDALVLVALCLVLWLLLDAVVTQRVRVVANYAHCVAESRPPPPPLQGADDLALISQEFANAVDAVHRIEARILEASERERRRIGADLHDDVCQRITAAQLKTGVLESSLTREGHPQADLASSVAAELGRAVKLARNFARGLAPMLVQRGMLPDALKGLARSIAEAFSMHCECVCDLDGKTLATWADTHIYRIVQELMTNAAKHARAKSIVASIVVEDGLLRIAVESDGIPFTAASRSGIGLEMVRQRARSLGGLFDIRPREDGTGGLAVCEVKLEARHFEENQGHEF